MRGISGTSRVARYIDTAMRTDPALVPHVLLPLHRRTRSSGLNAVREMRWDFRGAARSRQLDLLISPCNVGGAPKGLPHMLWVQDTMVLDHPALFDRKYVAFARAVFGPSVRRADVVVTSSVHSARRIEARWGNRDIRIIPWPFGDSDFGVTNEFSPDNRRKSSEMSREILMVGATEPHKNHAEAIRAISMLRDLSGAELTLRIVGPKGRSELAVNSQRLKYDPSGKWIVREERILDEAELRAAYQRAWILLQASLDEGFGLPLLEAARHGLPVVHSGCGAMPEILPHASAQGPSAPEMRGAMAALLDDDSYSRSQVLGYTCAQRFSWLGFQTSVLTLVHEMLS